MDGIHSEQLPSKYVGSEAEGPPLCKISHCGDIQVVMCGRDRSYDPVQIRGACLSKGIFKVFNHGVSNKLVEQVRLVGVEFLKLPKEEQSRLCSDDLSKILGLSTSSLNVKKEEVRKEQSRWYSDELSKISGLSTTSLNGKKEEVRNWRDDIRLNCRPLEQHVPEQISDPSSFKEMVSRYCTEVREFVLCLEESISESFGLERDYLRKVRGEPGQHMAINYYPPCPYPELTDGSPGHTDLDLDAVTKLLKDLQASGLEVLKNGKRLSVKPQSDEFVISIGDQLQARLRTIMDRHDAAKKVIEPKLLELHQMLADLAVKVQAQDKQIDNIEHYAINAFNCVQDGTKNLKRALRIIKAAVGAACVLGLLCFGLSWL